jgi:TfoX/Sxy family transcriptional regulator of competence genes
MASDLEFVEFVVDQMRDAGRIRYRKMFGEYAVYCDDKLVALVCDDQLFIKPTTAGRAFIEEPVEAPPYPGARPSLLIDGLDDHEWLSELVRLTAHELPESKPKGRRQGPSPNGGRQ